MLLRLAIPGVLKRPPSLALRVSWGTRSRVPTDKPTTGAASRHQNVKLSDLNLFLEARPIGANGMRLRGVRKVCLRVKSRHLPGENEG